MPTEHIQQFPGDARPHVHGDGAATDVEPRPNPEPASEEDGTSSTR